MIYEYPKEFMVPVVYVENLLQKRNESIREWNLFSMEENLQDNGKMESMGESQNANFSYMHQEILKNQYEESIYNYNIDQEISDNDNIKSILNDIDEDYAVNETLSM